MLHSKILLLFDTDKRTWHSKILETLMFENSWDLVNHFLATAVKLEVISGFLYHTYTCLYDFIRVLFQIAIEIASCDTSLVTTGIY